MDKSVWGPSLWRIIHLFHENYPEDPSKLDKEVAYKWITLIPFVIPCAECAEHSMVYIRSKYNEINNIISNKKNLTKFFVDFHNDVNVRLGKPIFYYDYGL